MDNITIVVDGYKHAKNIIKDNIQSILDEIEYAQNNGKIKRLIITPWFLWDAEEVYNKKGDVLICIDKHNGYSTNEAIYKTKLKEVIQ